MGLLSKIIAGLIASLVLFFIAGGVASAQGTGETKAAPIVCDLSSLKDDKDATLYPSGNPSWFLPDCVYFEGTTDQKVCGCRNINVLVQLLINIVNKILMVTGGVALLVFIYGGFLILTAAGGDNVKKGKETLVAAVIGLVIIFSAQLLLNFVLDIVVNKAAKELGGKTKVEGVQIKVPEVK